MRIGHPADDFSDQLFAGLNKPLKADGNFRHAEQAMSKLMRHIEMHRCQHFGHGPVVADEIHDEGIAEPCIDAFIGEQVTHVE